MSMESFLEKMAQNPSITLKVAEVDKTTGEITNFYDLPMLVDDSSYRYRTIMGEHTLNLKFSLPGYYEIPIGTYCEFQGQKYTLDKDPNIKENGLANFDYDLILHSPQYQLSKFMLRNTIPGDTRLKFSYTARPQEFLQLLVDNMNDRDEDEGWNFGEDYIESFEKVVSFNHNTCAEALQIIAEAFETEWEVKNKTIFLRKIEYNKDNPLPLAYGKGNGFLPGLGRSEYTEVTPVERLFVQGGDRNIDASKYRRTESTGQMGSRELLMPANTRIKFDGVYFDDEDNFAPTSPNVREYITDESGASVVRIENSGRKSLLEGSLDCSGVYPMREGYIDRVDYVEPENNFCDFSDDGIDPDGKSNPVPDYNKYQIEGEKMNLIFQTGMLTGKEFEFIYKYPGRFMIVPQTIDGIMMPGGDNPDSPIYLPAVGDKYGVFNVMLPDKYVTAAERSMLKQAVKYLYENEMPRFTFTGTLDTIWAKRDWINIGGRLVLGGYIRFSDTQFLPEGMDIRITGIKDYVNNPYKPEIELSNNSKSGSWIHGMKRQIESDQVTVETEDKKVVQFAKRRFRDVQETMDMIQGAMLDFDNPANPITLQTMQAVIGDEMLQFDYSGAKSAFFFDPDDENTFHAPAGTLTHKTLGIDRISSSLPDEYPYHWELPDFRSATLDHSNEAYYLYAVVPDAPGGGDGLFELSTAGRQFRENGNINLLVGIVNSEYGGTRSFAPLYGFTEILPGRIRTGMIVSETGETYFDLENNEIGGKINFKDGLVSGDIGIGNDKGINAGMSGKGSGVNGANLDSDVRIWAGGTAINKANAPFRVQHDGEMIASNANITGIINALGGVFTGQIVAEGVRGKISINPTDGLIEFLDKYLSTKTNVSYSGINLFNEQVKIALNQDSQPVITIRSGSTTANVTISSTSIAMTSNDYSRMFQASDYVTGSVSRLAIFMRGLPTSATGLLSGAVWRDGTTLRIVP